ncbi:hypothetical protein GEMRC1_010672 [Eukaryota sp. GEM-RC1]
MYLLISYAALTLVVSFICSLLESALYSVPRHILEDLSNNGKTLAAQKSAKRVLKYKDDIDRPLAAVLTLNTVVNIVGSSGVGGQTALVYGPEYSLYAGLILTLAILFFSEIVPKSIGSSKSRSLIGFMSSIIRFLIVFTFPLVILGELLCTLISGDRHTSTISRVEISTMANVAAASGSLSNTEAKVIKNLLSLRQVKVRDICTPRTVISGFSSDITVRQALDTDVFVRFTRVPVFKSFPDDCVGFVHRGSILKALTDGSLDTRVCDLVHHLHCIHEDVTVNTATHKLIEMHEHMFRVVDEFSGTEGLVTLEDCLETLLGVELVDETDVQVDLRQWALELANKRRTQKIEETDSYLENEANNAAFGGTSIEVVLGDVEVEPSIPQSYSKLIDDD